VVTKMPTLLGQIGELQSLLEAGAPVGSSSDAPTVRPLILDGMIRSTFEEIKRDMEGAYRGKVGDRLRQILRPDIAAMAPAGGVYREAKRSKFCGKGSDHAAPSY